MVLFLFVFAGTAGGTVSLSTGQMVGIVVGVIAAVCVAAGMQFSMYYVIACLRYVSKFKWYMSCACVCKSALSSLIGE